MLTSLRKQTGSLVIKGLLILLIVSFGAWGIEDWLTPAISDNVVATAGNQDISPNQLRRRIDRQMRKFREIFGNQISLEQALSFGIANNAVNDLVSLALMREGASDLGVFVSDTLIRDRIRANKFFSGIGGNFDRNRFDQFLQSSGVCEETFVNELRDELLIEHYAGSLSSGVRAPKIIVDHLFKYRHETREVELMTINAELMREIKNPTHIELQRFYQENEDKFKSLEFRRASYIHLKAEDFISEMSIDHAEVRSRYEENINEFKNPEKREVQQLVFDDKELAGKAFDETSKGIDFVTISKEFSVDSDPEAINLGYLTKNELLPELSASVFNLKKNQTSPPLKTSLGWHLLRVSNIEPGFIKSFSDVEAKLKREIGLEKASDYLYEISKKLDDNLGGGSTLEEAASSLSLNVKKINSIDRTGKNNEGRRLDGIASLPVFIKTIFELKKGEDSQLLEVGSDQIFVVRNDEVFPSALKPFQTVKNEVRQAWVREAKIAIAENFAKDLSSDINSGKSVEKKLQAPGVKRLAQVVVKRDQGAEDANLSQSFVDKIFDLKLGESDYSKMGSFFKIARLKRIQEAKPTEMRKSLEAFREELSQNIKSDLLVQLAEALKDKYGVAINQAVINQMYPEIRTP